MIIQLKQNDIEELPNLDIRRYENIFNVYTQGNGKGTSYYYFNILRKISIDSNNIDPEVFNYVEIAKPIPWTTISHDAYGTQHLWWLILAINNIINPVVLPKTGDTYKVIKKEYLTSILNQLKNSL